jgi:beta-galactosidase
MARKAIPIGMVENMSQWGWPDVRKSWNWSSEDGTKMNVVVYTRCQIVKLELNGKLIGEQKVPENSITVSFDVEYQPGTLIARGFDNGKEVASSILRTTGDPVAVRLKANRSRIKADRNDLSYINVEIVDANGEVVPNAENIEVQYSITGNGEIAGLGNGNPTDNSSFQQLKKKVWHGRGLAIVRPMGKPGKIILKANVKGLKEGYIAIVTQ